MKRIIFILVAMCCISCKTQTIVVPEYHHDTITQYRDRVSQVHDSIYIREYTQGDTVYVMRDRWHSSTDTIRDSVYISKLDSVPYMVEVQVPEKYVPGYYHFTSWCFWIIVVLLLISAAWWCIKKFYLHR